VKGKGFLKFLKDVDDVVHIITGKRLNQHAQRAWELFGPGKEKVEEIESDDPYAVLGVRRDAADVVIKASFRRLAKLYHPDGGEAPDPEKFRKIKEAYDRIEAERRGWKW